MRMRMRMRTQHLMRHADAQPMYDLTRSAESKAEQTTRNFDVTSGSGRGSTLALVQLGAFIECVRNMSCNASIAIVHLCI